jgi:Zn-dependent protease with chaperone function
VTEPGGSPLPLWVGLANVGIRLLVVAALTLGLTWSLHALVLRYARRLDGLHWTERARALWPFRNMMSFAAIGLGFVAALAVQRPALPSDVLGVAGLGVLAAAVAGSLAWWPRLELDVKLGAMSRPRSHPREALGVSLLFFPFVWILAALLLADLGDKPFGVELGTVAATAALVLTGLGAAAFLARELGLLLPASQRLEGAVARAARRLERPAPRAFELEWSRANAAALPILGWVLFSRRALDVLDDEQIKAIAAHEIVHVGESRGTRVFRVFGQLATLPLVIGVLEAQAGALHELLYGAAATALLFLAYGVTMRRLEQRAGSGEHRATNPSYAAALEALYRANLAPAVLRSYAHASLYERLIEAGKTPDYARPLPPRGWLRYLALPILPLFYWGYTAAMGLAAHSAPNSAEADTDRLYVAMALGNEDAEEALTARWAKAGRAEDALSQLRTTARFGDADWRWSRIFFLEMQRNNCAGALQALQSISAEDPSLGGFEKIWKAECDRAPRDER